MPQDCWVITKNSNIKERERERVQGPGWSNLTSKQNLFPIEA